MLQKKKKNKKKTELSLRELESKLRRVHPSPISLDFRMFPHGDTAVAILEHGLFSDNSFLKWNMLME